MKALLSRALLWSLRTLGTEVIRRGADVLGSSTPRTRLHTVEYPLCPRCNREMEPSQVVPDVPICRRCALTVAVPREVGLQRDNLIYHQIPAAEYQLKVIQAQPTSTEQQAAQEAAQSHLNYLFSAVGRLNAQMAEEVVSKTPEIQAKWGAA